ncbi:glycosyltransferase family 4 protein [uncultured Paraglaciecola sp.]|uniref:glycosyltransferase family 4 protein n=1 Tax=uncultured Paraglaciecola sp. TaxID=1765024 RepID=UPI00261C73D8|nr:glycosyltransferase family 4 protein [uncultured Paraglaciecola sp.]
MSSQLSTQNNQSKISVLCCALISPNKKGSYEDYLWHMCQEAKKRNWHYVICIIDPIQDELHQRLLDEGCEVLKMTKKQADAPWHLVNLLRTNKFDILHTHFAGPTDFVLLLCRCFWKGKIVFTDHSSGDLIEQAPGNFIKSAFRNTKRSGFSYCVDLYLPVSEFVKRRIIGNIPVAGKKVKLLYNGIDTDRFHPAANYEDKVRIKTGLLGVNDDRPIVIYVGQLIEEKGIRMCMKVMYKMLSEQIKCHFVIIGDGPARADVEQYCADTPFKDYVHYVGRRSDVNEILRITEVLLMPSLWTEAFGYIAAEASASGVPVIANNIGGIPEVIRHDHSGLLVTPGNQDKLEQALRTLLQDDKKRRQMGINGRQYALENFSLNTMVSKTFDHYQDLFSKSSFNCSESDKSGKLIQHGATRQ